MSVCNKTVTDLGTLIKMEDLTAINAADDKTLRCSDLSKQETA